MISSIAIMINYVKRYTKNEFTMQERAENVAYEALGALKTVLSLGLESKMIKSYSENLSDVAKISIKKGLVNGLLIGVFNFLYYSCFGIALYYGVHLFRVDCIQYGPAKIVTAFFSLINTSYAFGQAIPYLKDLAEAQGGASVVFKLLNTQSLIDMFDDYKKLGKKRLLPLRGNIIFQDVHFNYPTRSNVSVLRGMSLNIEAGKTVALVGPR